MPIQSISQLTGLSPVWLVVIIAWSLVWKGLALWRAARREEKVWFIALLVVNTVGILEIIYLAWFGRRPQSSH